MRPRRLSFSACRRKTGRRDYQNSPARRSATCGPLPEHDRGISREQLPGELGLCDVTLQCGPQYWDLEPVLHGYPSANVLPQKTPQDTVGKRRLLEFLPGEERGAFLADIKSKLTDSAGAHSVAIFWSSQGMCTVAATLGSNLPNFDCDTTKPPRNSFYVFAYDLNSHTFTRTGNYLQCFNFIPFATGALEDKFSFEQVMGFPAGFVPAQYYCPPSGNLAENDDPAYKCVFGTTGDKATRTPAANGSITAIQLSTLLRGQVCDVDNPQDNCHF